MEFAGADQPTRDRVCREILQRGPVTARSLGETLGLTPAAVRRHLDLLTEQGTVAVHEPHGNGSRGRGRPARRFVLTDAGHEQMSSSYDDLARHVLEFLAETAGSAAVEEFAVARAARLAARYAPVVERAGSDPHDKAEALARALSADGFAASVRSVADKRTESGDPALRPEAGKQLCQGHCPVQHVAERFPELCEAETRAFSQLLGVHVQRLATLAHGGHVCTTHVPGGPAAAPVPVTLMHHEEQRKEMADR